MDPIGGKRKFKENAFTAKAETGTLKVKILRKDLQSGGGAGAGGLSAAQAANAGTSLGSFLSATRAKLGQQQKPPEPPRSPPKPRPNRKHVPIFYQTHAHSSSSDGSAAAAISQTMSASSDGGGADASSSSTSYGGHFSSLLSGLQLGGASGSNSSAATNSLLRPPASNPLFSRNDSDGTLGDLLRHAFPSAQGPAPPLSFTSPATASSPLFTSAGSAAALQQLASSSASAAYGSSLASLSSAARDLSAGESALAAAPTSTIGYRFNPFTALQSAIDVHQATLSSGSHAPYQFPHERRSERQQDDEELAQQDASMDGEETDAVGVLGPPPTAPPAFAIQNSLVGGGIEMQPVIANVNTYNFDWSSRGGRPRSGSLPSVLENGPESSSSTSSDGSSAAASASHVHMWKEV